MEKRTKSKIVMGGILGAPVCIAGLVVFWSDPEEQSDVQIKPAEEAVTVETDDPREVFDARLGAQYDTIIPMQLNKQGCTVTDLGNGIAISAAHCFQNRLIFEKSNQLGGGTSDPSYVAFDCKALDQQTQCTFASEIIQVALPEQFGIAPNLTSTAWADKRGYDIAFIRYVFNQNVDFPKNHFDLKKGIDANGDFTQAGYSFDRPGLTGSDCKIIETQGENAEFIFTTDCYAVPQDSGSPVFQNGSVVGVTSFSSNDINNPQLGVTPITEEFLRALSAFRNQVLLGKEAKLQDGTPAILFDFERMPVQVQHEPQ